MDRIIFRVMSKMKIITIMIMTLMIMTIIIIITITLMGTKNILNSGDDKNDNTAVISTIMKINKIHYDQFSANCEFTI